MTPLIYFSAEDSGCYAAGALGHQHCRDTLASLVQDVAERSNRWGEKEWGVSIGELTDSLRREMPDDAWDEASALEILQEVTVQGVYWTFEGGDLLLLAAEDEAKADEQVKREQKESNRIVAAMARAMYVSAYADFVDNHADLNLPQASMGEDWMNVAPETPDYVVKEAWRLCGKFEALNKSNIYVLAAQAWWADYPELDKDAYYELRDDEKDTHYDDFGHCLAMQAMGHGVSWFDDHEKFEITFPHIEWSMCDLHEYIFHHAGEEEGGNENK